MKSNRNIAIEALRFLMIMQICFWHYHGSGLAAGYLGVEFFFILSGVFTYKLSGKPDAPGAIAYTMRKVKKFYPLYLAGVIIAIMAYRPVWGDADLVPKVIVDALMLQSVGIFKGTSANGPLWFFSVLIYGGAIVYTLCRNLRTLSLNLIFPALILMFLVYSFDSGAGNGLEMWHNEGPLPLPLLRGICEMGIGVLLGHVIANYGIVFSRHLGALNAATSISAIGYLSVLFFGASHAALAVIFICVLIAASLTQLSWIYRLFSGRTWLSLGALAYPIYVIHLPLGKVVDAVAHYFPSPLSEHPVILLALFILPVGWMLDKAVVLIIRLAGYAFANRPRSGMPR